MRRLYQQLKYRFGFVPLLGYAMLCHLVRGVTARRRPAPDEETTVCPVCQEPRSWYLFSRRDRLRYANISNNRFFDLVKCRTCGHVYINPRLKEAVLRDIYEKDLFETYKYDARHATKVGVLHDAYHDRLPDRLATFERYLAVIRKHVSGGRLMDIGTCYAYFLQTAKRLGFAVSGVELSRQCVEFSRKDLGIEAMQQGNFLDVDVTTGPFDAITLWHAIEHLYQPAETIRKISGLLKPGACFFLTCPVHQERFLIRSVQPVEHLHYFRRDTLVRLVLANFDGDFVTEDDLVFVFRKR